MATWWGAWFGPIPEGSGGGGVRLLIEGDIGMPVHTRVIEILQAEMPSINVWPDVDQNRNAGDRIVVENRGGDWDNHFNSHQRRSRMLHIWSISDTSDGAERLIDKVAYIIRRVRNEMRVIAVEDLQGGYNQDVELYFRGLMVRMHGR